MPKGSMLDMIEQVTRMSYYQDNFNKQRFFKNAKYVKSTCEIGVQVSEEP